MSEQHSFELTRNSKFNPPASSPREADRTPRTWPRRNAAPVGTVPLVNSERAEPKRFILLYDSYYSMQFSVIAFLVALRSFIRSRLELQLRVAATMLQILTLSDNPFVCNARHEANSATFLRKSEHRANKRLNNIACNTLE